MAAFGAVAFGQQGEDRWPSVYRVDPAYPHHVVNAQGRHLFILNKTAWAYFACKDPKGVLERASAQGANVIRVALEGTPYFLVLKMDMWPWGGIRQSPEWTKFDAAYWDEVERRIALAKQFGIGIDVVLYFTLKPGADEVPRQRACWKQACWKQALTRLGRHTNLFTWEIARLVRSSRHPIQSGVRCAAPMGPPSTAILGSALGICGCGQECRAGVRDNG